MASQHEFVTIYPDLTQETQQLGIAFNNEDSCGKFLQELAKHAQALFGCPPDIINDELFFQRGGARLWLQGERANVDPKHYDALPIHLKITPPDGAELTFGPKVKPEGMPDAIFAKRVETFRNYFLRRLGLNKLNRSHQTPNKIVLKFLPKPEGRYNISTALGAPVDVLAVSSQAATPPSQKAGGGVQPGAGVQPAAAIPVGAKEQKIQQEPAQISADLRDKIKDAKRTFMEIFMVFHPKGQVTQAELLKSLQKDEELVSKGSVPTTLGLGAGDLEVARLALADLRIEIETGVLLKNIQQAMGLVPDAAPDAAPAAASQPSKPQPQILADQRAKINAAKKVFAERFMEGRGPEQITQSKLVGYLQMAEDYFPQSTKTTFGLGAEDAGDVEVARLALAELRSEIVPGNLLRDMQKAVKDASLQKAAAKQAGSPVSKSPVLLSPQAAAATQQAGAKPAQQPGAAEEKEKFEEAQIQFYIDNTKSGQLELILTFCPTVKDPATGKELPKIDPKTGADRAERFEKYFAPYGRQSASSFTDAEGGRGIYADIEQDAVFSNYFDEVSADRITFVTPGGG